MKTIGFFAMLAAALIYNPVTLPGQTRLPRCVFGNGGTEATSPAHRISGTIGQPLIGGARSAGNQGYLGFWYSAENIPVAVEDISGDMIPTVCSIDAVFPNPMQGTVSIRYAIPVHARAALLLFDLWGRNIGTLVDDEHRPGVYRLQSRIGDRPSGTYVLRLSAGGHVVSKRVVLVQ